MRKEAIIFLIILVLAAALAFLTGKQAFLLVLIVLLAYLLLAVLHRLFCGRKTALLLDCRKECAKKEFTEAVLEIQNQSFFPILSCSVRISVRNRLNGIENEKKIVCSVGPRKKKRVFFEAGDDFCGCLQIEVSQVLSSDPLFLFSRRITARALKEELLVLPEPEEYPLSSESLEAYNMESFRFADGKTGSDSSEIVGIRDYAEGDSVRAIHWKLSAKTGSVLVKEYGYPVDTRLMLLTGKHCSEAVPEKRLHRIDVLTEFSLSVSYSLLKKGIGHTIGWYDAETGEFLTRTLHDPDDIYLLMPDFLRTSFAENADQTILRFLSSGADRNYAGYLLITDMPEEENDIERLREYGQVTILTPEPVQ